MAIFKDSIFCVYYNRFLSLIKYANIHILHDCSIHTYNFYKKLLNPILPKCFGWLNCSSVS